MKRHPALIPLSRDHHDGLVQAVRLRRATADGDASARLAAAKEFVEFFRNEERVHLRDEEEELFPLFLRHVQSPPAPLRDARLQHVQLEERQLFPLIEELVPDDELRRLGLASKDLTCAVRRPAPQGGKTRIPRGKQGFDTLHGSRDPVLAQAAATAGAFPAQYRLRAPCTFTNQTIAGMIRIPPGKSQRPVQPVMGGSCPSFAYIFPTSEGITKASTGLMRIQMTRPRTPPRPSPVCCFISSWLLKTQYQE